MYKSNSCSIKDMLHVTSTIANICVKFEAPLLYNILVFQSTYLISLPN